MAFETDVDNDNVRYIFENMVYGNEDRDFSLAWDWVKKHPQLHCWIDGRYVEINGSSTSSSDNPGSVEELTCDVPALEGDSFAEAAVNSAIEAQSKWININVDTRQEIMFKLSKVLQAKGQFVSQLCNLNDEDFDMIIEYFNFCSDLSIDKWESVGTVLVKLSSETPAWVVAMHVSSALSAGCSVIINPSPKACFFSFILAEICADAGLPKGLVNVVPGRKKTYQEFLKMDIQKVIYNGHLKAEDFIGYKMPPHISVLTPNHTTFILLETCDVQAALDKLFFETWKNVPKTIWGIDTLIIQESIYHDFLYALAQKIKNNPLTFTENVRLRETLIDAVQSGAKVVHAPNDVEKLVPIVVSQHYLDFGEIPIMTMMTAKTADEAAALANGAHYCVGTSVWTENCAQALQVSSQLESSIVWINSHGIMDATISFEPSRRSGLGCFGGLEGVLENRTLKPLETGNDVEDTETPEYNLEADELADAIRSSIGCFQNWKRDKNRKKYLKDIAESMISENLMNYISDLNVWANMGNSYELLKGCKRPDMHALQNKKPIGIIVMVLMDSEDALECFTSFVSPAIAFGNVIIAVMNSDIAYALKPLVDCYRQNLPDGVLNVLEGTGYAPILATDTNVQAISVCTDQQDLALEVQELKKISVINFKRFWVQPSIERSMSEYPKRFLKEQTTFLPKYSEST